MSENLETGQAPAPDTDADNVVQFPVPDEPTDLDDQYDELDEAAAAQVEDFRLPTRTHPEPVDGEALFADLTEAFDRFMLLPPGAAEVASLWTVMTYAVRASSLRFAPRLIITAPGPNSGKTTLLEVLAHLVFMPEPASEITPASYFRLASHRHTILIDECDHSLPSRSTVRNPLTAMINAAHKSATAVVERVESIGKEKCVVRYNTFGPVALAGIGDFGTPPLKSRSYIIRLKPKLAGEQIDEFVPLDHAPAMRGLRSRIRRWVTDHKDAIRDCRPDLDRELYNNRALDNSTMLLQIADTIGGVCSARARDAIKLLTRGDVLDANALLLGDIASIVQDESIMVGEPPRRIGHDGIIFSGDLYGLLVEHYPDREFYTGFSQSRLASMLRAFDIEPIQKRRGKQVLRAYRSDQFTEWFVRYGFADISDCSGVEPSVTETPPPAPEPAPVAPLPPTPLHEAFPNAFHAPIGKGDKKRAKKLRVGIEAMIQDKKILPGDVVFTSGLFWLLDDASLFVHLDEDGEFTVSPIDGAGLVVEPNVVVINRETRILPPPHEFPRWRALVNKANVLL